MNYGFVKIASAIPELKVADCEFNEKQIENLIIKAEGKGVEIISFPELCLTGYTCGDLFAQQLLIDAAENTLYKLLNFTRSLNIISIIGMPMQFNSMLLNVAVVIQCGKILGVIPKTYLPNYKEYSEKRWFVSAFDFPSTTAHLCAQTVNLGGNIIFHTNQTSFSVELCEDLFAPVPPSSKLALSGAEIIFNLSACSESVGRYEYIKSLIKQQSERCICAYAYTSAGYGESTQDLVYSGNAFIYENGQLLSESERFSFEEQLIITEIDVQNLRNDRRVNTIFNECVRTHTYSFAKNPNVVSNVATIVSSGTAATNDAPIINIQCTTTKLNEDFELTRYILPHPFIPEESAIDERCNDILSIQIGGLAKRIKHTNARTVIIGISGGLDSTLALLVCVKTFDKLGLDRKNIIGITMPGFGTTDRTYNNAISLMKQLGISIMEISIKESCIQHFNDIGHDISNHDVTYENAQARERTQILMDIANQKGGFVVGTGDLSELALGWATYNADHMSHYGVNCSIPKTLIKHIVKFIANSISDVVTKNTLHDILDTPVSPELLPASEDGDINQKTEDLVGPYELHDFFLYHFIRYNSSPQKIFYLAQNAFKNRLEYDDITIKKWLTVFLKRFFTQQFKRSCLPDGPKVGYVGLSPRGDWRMPSDASYNAWIAECEQIKS